MPGRWFLAMNCTIDARYVSRKRSGTSMSPWGRAALIVANAPSKSLVPRTSTVWSFTPSASAADRVPFKTIVVKGLAGFRRTATRDSLGTTCFEDFEPFPLQLFIEGGEPRYVAARLCQARHEAGRHRISSHRRD